MYLYLILFIFFSFFMSVQHYAVDHFTGSLRIVKNIISIFSFLNLLLLLAFIIHFAMTSSFWLALLFIPFSIIANYVLNIIVASIVFKIYKKEDYDSDIRLLAYDIVFNVIAEIGILANIAIVIFYILNAF